MTIPPKQEHARGTLVVSISIIIILSTCASILKQTRMDKPTYILIPTAQ
jgi:hypothetical protein